MTSLGIRRMLAPLQLAVPGMILATFGAEAVFHPGLIGFGILFAFGLPAIWLLTQSA